MKPVFVTGTGVVAPLARSSSALWEAIAAGKSAVFLQEDNKLSTASFWAARFTESERQYFREAAPTHFLPFEQMAFSAAKQAIASTASGINPDTTLLILSSTKGAISNLNQLPDERILLHRSAQEIAVGLGILNKPVVVSHACVSGVSALIHAQLYLNAGKYENIIVLGADVLSRFVLSGFQSFQAVADGPCKPFDKDRAGINLGEASACIILSSKKENAKARFIAGATSNDANHISGPSRTGEELSMAIDKSIKLSNLAAKDINFISAHGTATLYNDEMEAKAFAHSKLLNAPLFSSKAATGHTLGAAGLLESILLIESLKHQKLLPSIGYKHHGISEPVLVATESIPANLQHVLKTASGFGGCNAAAVFGKV